MRGLIVEEIRKDMMERFTGNKIYDLMIGQTNVLWIEKWTDGRLDV